MKVLFISKSGDSFSLATRIADEGHNVSFHCPNKIGDGLISKPKYRMLVSSAGKPSQQKIDNLLRETSPSLVVFDMVGMGRVADYISSLHIPVFGGSLWADLLELDRGYGTQIMRVCGITVPPTKEFHSIEEAITYVKSRAIDSPEGRLVYKPFGNVASAHTYISKGKEDLIEMMKLYSEVPFELQDFVEGVEISCELWWNGRESFLHNWTMEEKRFMNDNLGPTIGCAGNVVRTLRKDAKLVSEGVGKIEKLLKKTNYRGPIDLNSIISGDKLYGLEWTSRLGYDAIQALMELCTDDILTIFYNIATGATSRYYLRTDEHAMAIRVTIPPYPSEEGFKEGIPILGINNQNAKHIWLGDVMKRDGKLVSAGADANILCVTARGSGKTRGDVIREAQRRCLRTLEGLIIPDVQYRTDIGKRVPADSSSLREWF